MEEFKKSVTFSVRSHLDDHKVTNVKKAAMMADEYEFTHKNDNRPPSRNFSGKRDKFQSSAPKILARAQEKMHKARATVLLAHLRHPKFSQTNRPVKAKCSHLLLLWQERPPKITVLETAKQRKEGHGICHVKKYPTRR